jgi:hypothetical protein
MTQNKMVQPVEYLKKREKSWQEIKKEGDCGKTEDIGDFLSINLSKTMETNKNIPEK